MLDVELMRACRYDAEGSLEVPFAQIPVRITTLPPIRSVHLVSSRLVSSHADRSSFSGKTSGRMKTEKRLKKIAEERKQEAMIASDTPLGMSEAFARRAAKTGEAHMVLSVGNKGSVQASSKGKARR